MLSHQSVIGPILRAPNKSAAVAGIVQAAAVTHQIANATTVSAALDERSGSTQKSTTCRTNIVANVARRVIRSDNDAWNPPDRVSDADDSTMPAATRAHAGEFLKRRLLRDQRDSAETFREENQPQRSPLARARPR